MSVSPKAFYNVLAANGVGFVTGVPDSLLKEFCAYVDAALPSEQHVIAANEGTAIAIAAGTQLATGGLPLIYLQNSGLGNIINPLLSLADSEVYSIPMIIMIGWRGEPGVKDEPQHLKQGRVTTSMLDAMEIPYRYIDDDSDAAVDTAKWATATAIQESCPVILLVRKNAFDKAEKRREAVNVSQDLMSREDAIGLITDLLPAGCVVVSTTGMISRELYEMREARGQKRSSDFLTVGSMGHASQIALGIALGKPDVDVVCIDGDGAALMHMGGLATIGSSCSGNLLHIVLNNGVHDSVGGQPTVAMSISLTEIAKACRYDQVIGPLERKDEICSVLENLSNLTGKRFVELRVRPGSRSDLGRPKETPVANKEMFIKSLRGIG